MITVNEFFGNLTAAQQEIIFNDVLPDLKLYANNNGLTTNDICELVTTKYGDLYLNGSPTIAGFSRALSVWHKSRQYYFDKLYQTTLLEYDPIYNVDETETITETRTPDIEKTSTENGGNTTTYGKTEQVTDSVTGTNKVTPFDDSTNFYNDSQSNQSGTTTNTNGGADSTTHNKTQTNTETGTEETETERHRMGNIGVTSSQDLIEQERKIANFDLLDIWLERFSERFLVPVWHTEF